LSSTIAAPGSGFSRQGSIENFFSSSTHFSRTSFVPAGGTEGARASVPSGGGSQKLLENWVLGY